MKHGVPLLWASALLIRLAPAFGAQFQVQESPIGKVVTLITTLKATIEGEGKKEQKSYDKYACWCEATLARKAKAIADAKETIDDSQKLVLKLKAGIATHGADVSQLEKDIAENKKSQSEATEVRNKENAAYEAEKTESEQCMGALEAAVTVLTGAGEGKKAGFLETMQDAQLLSVAAQMRKVLLQDAAVSYAEDHDIDIVRKFVAHPEDFAAMAKKARGGSFVQAGNNPFGDYAPQSTQIQGILKGMYDSFAFGLEKANGEEASKQKAFEELMATKQMELQTLEDTLMEQTDLKAKKTKQLADTETLRDDTKEQLKADEIFFKDTKAGCKAKAEEWSERSRLRTEELMGIDKATEILTSPEAQQIFANATTTLLQVSSRSSAAQGKVSAAAAKLRGLATRFGNQKLGKIAAQVKLGGHFDKVIVMIDEMVAVLRQEEQDDIAHRDRCERGTNKNSNDLEDLQATKTKTEDEIKRMGGEKTKLEGTAAQLKLDIVASKDDLRQMLEMRNQESAQFKQALKDDAAAVQILQRAILALGSFYKNNKIESLVQQPDREYTVDKDKAPETSWEGDYGGKKTENRGITSTLEMIVEDLENEMKTARVEEDEAQASFEEDREAARKVLDAQKKTLVETEADLAELEEKTADKQDFLAQTEADISTQKQLENNLAASCAWVKDHFESRRKARKAEIDGCNEAKAILAGVEAGDYDQLELAR